MTYHKIFYFLTFIILIFLFSSCIDIENSIVLNKDGSGTESVVMQYSKSIIDIIHENIDYKRKHKEEYSSDSLTVENELINQIQEKYKDVDGLKLEEVSVNNNEDSSITVKFKDSFDNIEKKVEIIDTKDTTENKIFGKTIYDVSFKKESGKIFFSYDTHFEYPNGKDKFLIKFAALLFKNKKMKVKYTFPFKIINSNALTTDGNTLYWEYNMDKLMEGTQIININVEMEE